MHTAEKNIWGKMMEEKKTNKKMLLGIGAAAAVIAVVAVIVLAAREMPEQKVARLLDLGNHSVQSSMRKPFTRVNSFILCVTRMPSSDITVAAIIKSFGPIKLPEDWSSLRIRP